MSPVVDDSSKRHIACNRCRLRKVKCDGRRPWCRKCSGTGEELQCSYGLSSGPKAKKRQSFSAVKTPESSVSYDRVSMIQKLHSLSPSPPCTNANDIITAHVSDFESIFPGLQNDGNQNNAHVSTNVESQDLALDIPFVWASPSTMDSSGSSIDSHSSGDLSFDLTSSMGSHCADPLMTLYDSLDAEEVLGVPQYLADILTTTYFDSQQATSRFVNRQDFLAQSRACPSPEIVAITYGMWALAAPTCPQFKTWAASNPALCLPDADFPSYFYRQARFAFEQCDLAQPFMVPTLRILQAVVLITVYETQHATFDRAWLTMCRVTWLIDALRLDEETSDSDSPTLCNEETRQTVWAAKKLTSFLCLGGRTSQLTALCELTKHLPLPSDEQYPPMPILRLTDVFNKTAIRSITVPEGLTAACMLLPRVVAHIQAWKEADRCCHLPYNFWTQQYHLQELITYIETSTANTDISIGFYDIDASSTHLILVLVLKSLSIVLHEALIRRAFGPGSDSQDVPTETRNSYAASSGEAARRQVAGIYFAMQATACLDRAKTDMLVPWAVYVALQSLIRQQRRDLSSSLDPISSTSRTSLATTSEHCQWASDDMWSDCEFSEKPSNALDYAVALDTIAALRATLRHWGCTSSLAQFFSDEITLETVADLSVLDKRAVGLANLTAARV